MLTVPSQDAFLVAFAPPSLCIERLYDADAGEFTFARRSVHA